jgi:hypothetical protein
MTFTCTCRVRAKRIGVSKPRHLRFSSSPCPRLRDARASVLTARPNILVRPHRHHNAEVFLRLLRCVPHARQYERAQGAQQRPQPPAQRAGVLRTDLLGADTAGHQQHHGCVQRGRPGESAVCSEFERRLPWRAHGRWFPWRTANADAWRSVDALDAVGENADRKQECRGCQECHHLSWVEAVVSPYTRRSENFADPPKLPTCLRSHQTACRPSRRTVCPVCRPSLAVLLHPSHRTWLQVHRWVVRPPTCPSPSLHPDRPARRRTWASRRQERPWVVTCPRSASHHPGVRNPT